MSRRKAGDGCGLKSGVKIVWWIHKTPGGIAGISS